MDLSLMALGGLAAAMALDVAPDPVPAAPRETPVSCEEAQGEAAKAKCRRDRNELDPLTIEGAKPGDTEGPIEPELVLDEVIIKAMGVNTIGDLLRQLAPVLNNARGRGDEPPIILINGKRVVGDMTNIPAEAVLRAAPLREEEALAHGYRADQLVFNITLKKRFDAVTLTSEGLWPMEGGRASSDHMVNLFKVQGEGRTTVTARYHRDSPLFEDERDVVRTPPPEAPFTPNGTIASTGAALVAGPGLSAARTLAPRTEQARIDAAYTREIGGGVTATVATDLQAGSTVSFRGLPSLLTTLPAASPYSPFAGDVDLYRYLDAPEALKQRTDTHKVGLALGLAGKRAGWRWTLDGDVDRLDTASRIGRGLDTSALRAALAASRVDPFGAIPADLLRYAPRDTADSVATSAKLNMTLNGTLAGLPAGRILATARAGIDSRRFDAESVRSGIRIDRVLTRDRTSLGGNLNIPVLDRSGPLARLGKVSLNANGLYERFSDIGGLATIGGGLAWSPIRGLNVSADYSWEEGEPTPQQMNNPVQQTASTPIYDYLTGEVAYVTVTSGGNPALRPDDRQLFKLDVSYKPFQAHELKLATNYTVTRTDDVIANFPSVSPELEAAFPTRFIRDAQGRLIGFDNRAVNFEHADSADLRSRVTYMRRWGGPKPGTGPNSLFVVLNDRWRLRDEVTIHDGMAPLDKLRGASLGQFRGSPRHEVNLSINVGSLGYSWGLSGFWSSPTQVTGGARTGDLRYSAPPVLVVFTTLDLGAQKGLAQGRPWLKGMKLMARVENLFDTALKVRDEAGLTPEAYQRAIIAAQSGRAVRLSLRKQF